MSGQQTSIQITDAILLSGTKRGARLFRQNTGMGWVGKILKRAKTSITLGNPRPLHAGLCKGSSDVVGITPVTVTPDMVGKTVGLFTAVEVKAGQDRLTPDQKRFLAMVERIGGVAICARSIEGYEGEAPDVHAPPNP